MTQPRGKQKQNLRMSVGENQEAADLSAGGFVEKDCS
jgi:hypothetical protein